jgi:NAD(P)-dependent dehydrogenase (short-subunit alcohol dehydrogenase family)
MNQLQDKVAVVTGGASGIGLALVRRFAAEGARVVIADVEAAALEEAYRQLADEHGADRVMAVSADVRHPEAVEALAEATFDQFGAAHVVCNNAGVAVGGLAWEIPVDRWQWIVDVNLMGVAHGVRAFVPRMIEQGEGHVVNTASAAGLITGPAMAPYYATKHAVVALSEALEFDLKMSGSSVGVSVLCPEFVRTRIGESERNLPDEVSAATATGMEGFREAVQGLVASGIDPAEVADAVVDAIRTGRFWILTHPTTTLDAASRRWDAIASDGRPSPMDWGRSGRREAPAR